MIGKVIKSIFTSDSDLSTLFSGRVYPVVGAQGKDNPMVVYDVTNIIAIYFPKMNTPSVDKWTFNLES